MNSDTSVLKWTAIVAAVIIGCFCIGYFLGPNFPLGGGDGKASTPPPGSTQVAMETGSDAPRRVPRPQVTLVDETATVEAENRKKEAERKRLEDEKKRKEEEERKKLEEEAAKLAATPTPAPTPDPLAVEEPREPDASTDATPQPEPGAEEPTRPEPEPVKPEPEKPKVVEAPKPEKRPEKPAETPKPSPKPATEGTLFKVRVGNFSSEDNAKRKASELSGRGYQTRVVSESVGGKKVYRVQVGAYKDKANADRTALELRANGEDPEVGD